jgi:uncharacterized protein
MPGALRERVLAYLRRHHVMTLATHGPDGPWAAAVYYANDGFSLVFLSSPTSRHCGNLASNPRAAATIQEDYADWKAIKGVQLEGNVVQLHDADESAARALYAKKFPVARSAGTALAQALKKVRWYRLAPERLHFIDNAAGFGHRDEISLS